MSERIRCPWCLANPTMRAYHDREWGVPLHDDRKHFEFLVLDAFQAGLSWAIILNKREGFRRAFAGFDPRAVARFNRRSLERLRADPGIVRNRQKIEATVANARAFLELQATAGSFDRFAWGFVDGRTVIHHWRHQHQLPATSRASDAMSRELRARGFSFVGSTICYAYMQAAGLVNDHLVSCYRWEPLARRAAGLRPRKIRAAATAPRRIPPARG